MERQIQSDDGVGRDRGAMRARLVSQRCVSRRSGQDDSDLAGDVGAVGEPYIGRVGGEMRRLVEEWLGKEDERRRALRG